MAIEHHYQSPISGASPFDDVLDQVRLGDYSFITDGQLGAVGTSGIWVDDPEGVITLLPWQRYYALELAGRASAVLTGTVTKATTSLDLVGAGSAFLTELAAGDEVAVPGGGGTDYLFVASVIDDTHALIFLAPAFSASGQTATRSALRRLFSGWTGPDVNEDRGDGDPSGEGGDPADAGRIVQVDLADVNTALHFRLLRSAAFNKGGAAGGATVSGDRLAAFLASPEISGRIYDEGRVVYGTAAVSAADLRNQYGDAFLNSLAQMDRSNFSLVYHEATGHLELVYGPPGRNDRPSPLALSSVEADIDVAGFVYPGIDAKLNRAGGGIMAGEQVVGANGSSYVTDLTTADLYEFRDVNASDSTLKDAAARVAYGNGQLADGTEPDDKVTVAVILPPGQTHLVARLNGIQARFPFLTGWADWRWARILHVDLGHAPAAGQVAQVTPGAYKATLVLAPCDAPSPAPTYTFGAVDRNLISEGESESVGTFLMGASGTGDSPPIGDAYSSEPKTGLIDYHYATAGPQIGQPSGFEFLGHGEISIDISVNAQMAFDFGSPGGTTVQLIAKIGAAVVASSPILTDTGTGLHSFNTGLSISASGIPVVNGDVLQIYYAIGVTRAHIAAIPPAGTFAPPYQLVVVGALS